MRLLPTWLAFAGVVAVVGSSGGFVSPLLVMTVALVLGIASALILRGSRVAWWVCIALHLMWLVMCFASAFPSANVVPVYSRVALLAIAGSVSLAGVLWGRPRAGQGGRGFFGWFLVAWLLGVLGIGQAGRSAAASDLRRWQMHAVSTWHVEGERRAASEAWHEAAEHVRVFLGRDDENPASHPADLTIARLRSSELTAYLRSNAAAVESGIAASWAQPAWDREFTTPARDPARYQLFGDARKVSRVMSVACGDAIAKGDIDRAVVLVDALGRLIRQIEALPLLLPYAHAVAVMGDVHRCVALALDKEFVGTPEQLTDLGEALLRAHRGLLPLGDMLEGERVYGRIDAADRALGRHQRYDQEAMKWSRSSIPAVLNPAAPLYFDLRHDEAAYTDALLAIFRRADAGECLTFWDESLHPFMPAWELWGMFDKAETTMDFILGHRHRTTLRTKALKSALTVRAIEQVKGEPVYRLSETQEDITDACTDGGELKIIEDAGNRFVAAAKYRWRNGKGELVDEFVSYPLP